MSNGNPTEPQSEMLCTGIVRGSCSTTGTGFGQTALMGKEQKHKQWSTKHHTEDKRSSNTNRTKICYSIYIPIHMWQCKPVNGTPTLPAWYLDPHGQCIYKQTTKELALIRFHSKRQHTITKMNDNINIKFYLIWILIKLNTNANLIRGDKSCRLETYSFSLPYCFF